MTTIKKACLFVAALLICSIQADACTIFMQHEGHKVLVGNNEDYIPTAKSWLWVRPRTEVANGYILWGFQQKYPEGGMNEKGLFIDAAALPEKIAIIRDPNKPDFNGYITEKILRECSSVGQAVALVSRYNLTWQEKAQIMIVDKSGDYAVIHANYIIRKSANTFALTNYSIGGPTKSDFTCWRRNTVEEELKDNPFSVALFRNTLAKIAQTEPDNATVYSQVCDLENGIIYLYQKHNFNQVATLSLPKILRKGRRDIAINTLFPRDIGDIFALQIDRSGLATAFKTYARLKKSANHQAYDFSEGELDNTAYSLLNRQKFKEAIAVFKLNIRAYPRSANAKAGLANAFLLQGSTMAADQEYLKVRHEDTANHYLNLFGHHEDNVISFVISGFDGAKVITLFLRNTVSGTLITQHLNRLKKGKWDASLKVPPGPYTYLFRVDDSYIIDPGNRVTSPAGRYLNSFLISR